MAKVIKGVGVPPAGASEERGVNDLGINPETGFADLPRKKPAIVSKEEFAAGNDARKVVVDAEKRAEGILAEAEREAREIVARGQTEAAELKASAHDLGLAEGSDQAAAKFTDLIAQHARRMEKKENEAAGQIRQLALAIAKKIIGKELEFHPEAIVDMAKKHLGQIRQRREVFLRVSPADLEVLREHKRELIDQLGRAKEIELKADDSLTQGSIVIETEAGSIDARLETQLSVIEKVLMGRSPV